MTETPTSPSGPAEMPPGWRRIHESSVSSTQDLARAAAMRGAGSRLVFTADFQTQGRGRQGRTWIGPRDSSLMLTILLHHEPLSPVEHTVLAAVALCESLECILALAPRIKWPNDVLLADRKVAGVLAESSSDAPGYVAIGIGLNTRWRGRQPDGVPAWATALDAHTAEIVDSATILSDLVRRLDTWLASVASDGASGLWRCWTDRLWRRGEVVRVQLADRTIEGRIRDCSRSGALLLEQPDGNVLDIFAGDIALPGELSGRLLAP